MWRYVLLLLAMVGFAPLASAYTPQYCFEIRTNMCGLVSGNATQIFSGILLPLESQVPGFAMVIFLGGIFAILWFKTENIMLLAIVGIFFVATLGTVGAALTVSDTAIGIGLLLLAVSIGILIFQMIRQRIALFG